MPLLLWLPESSIANIFSKTWANLSPLSCCLGYREGHQHACAVREVRPLRSGAALAVVSKSSAISSCCPCPFDDLKGFENPNQMCQAFTRYLASPSPSPAGWCYSLGLRSVGAPQPSRPRKEKMNNRMRMCVHIILYTYEYYEYTCKPKSVRV